MSPEFVAENEKLYYASILSDTAKKMPNIFGKSL